MTSVCFTGHRKIDSPDMYALKSLLDSTICGLVKRGVTDFYCGGALGFVRSYGAVSEKTQGTRYKTPPCTPLLKRGTDKELELQR